MPPETDPLEIPLSSSSEMTDSIGSSIRRARRHCEAGKREPCGSAAELLHRQGVERTTLAEIAQLADVTGWQGLYYFKTKDEVIEAVVEAHVLQVSSTLAAIDARHRTPKARLKTLVHELAGQSETVAQYGCPLAAFALRSFSDAMPGIRRRETHAHHRPLGQVHIVLEQGDQSLYLALDLLAAYQGNALLAKTSRSKILSAVPGRLERRIDAV